MSTAALVYALPREPGGDCSTPASHLGQEGVPVFRLPPLRNAFEHFFNLADAPIALSFSELHTAKIVGSQKDGTGFEPAVHVTRLAGQSRAGLLHILRLRTGP
jgi:hypothetical protein